MAKKKTKAGSGKRSGGGLASENWRLAQEMAKEIDRLRVLEDRAKENLAQRRKAKEAQIEEMMNFVRGAEAPLFDAANIQGEGDADSSIPATPKNPAPEPGDWETQPLAEIDGMPAAALKAFNKVSPEPLVTLGDLQKFQAKKGEFWAKDINGIGPAARQKIEDALENFWTRRKAAEAEKVEGERIAREVAVT